MSSKEIKKELVDLSYRVSKIQTTKFAFEDIDSASIESVFKDLTNLNLSVSISTQAIVEDLKFTVDLSTKLEDKSGQRLLVEHIGRTVFHVEGMESIYNSKTKAIDFPTALIVQMYGIAFSHARALLAIELAPTCYRDKYMLPIIDPSILLNMSNIQK